jgi:ABC-type bacteriocin/lantibiotic exporter with double-glycine peptidase domain
VKKRIPEVIQTSGMDCGPASLKALLEGLGISVSYGRLREACQTDVDGTSIDTMEEIAKQLGVDAEQVMVPWEHVVHDPGSLPAIAVVRLPNGLTHFIVVWRRIGGRVEIMDPGAGRRRIPLAQLRQELYVHQTEVPAEAWREWAGGDEAIGVTERRLATLGVHSRALIDAALQDPTWRGPAVLDAALRMVELLVQSRAVGTAQVPKLLAELTKNDGSAIPESMWSAWPGAEAEHVRLRGMVLVCARGRRAPSGELPASLAAALSEPPLRPARDIFRLLRADGLLGPAALTLALAVAAATGILEALLFRGLLDIGRQLGVVGERLAGLAAFGLMLALTALLEAPILGGVQGLGRRLETRLRIAFLGKIPRLGDRYFHSRPVSDTAERSHSLHVVRQLPRLGSDLIRASFELIVTTAGLAWIDPRSTPLAILAAASAVALPILTQRSVVERDLKQRAHNGALARFYLDALLGLVAVRTHGAARAVRREHESLLVEWMSAGRSLLSAVLSVEALQALVGFGLAALLLFTYLGRAGESASVLLYVYWALDLPVVGRDIAMLLRQYPSARNVMLRMAEPLGAREESDGGAAPPSKEAARGLSVRFDDVVVMGGGHRILEGVNLSIASGEHVAIVGPSGAGKSTLVGLLLGWHEAASGRVITDGQPLGPAELARLRTEVAWCDPEVQLWNRSLLDNLRYGAGDEALDVSPLVSEAGLLRVLENLPEGLQTNLGEGGGLVSGGEGQRVRFARALNKKDARLVILDEAFRGHDHETRQKLLRRARALFQPATLLCITHDVGEARSFPRVLVVDGGRVVEDGAPSELDREGTRFRALLDAESVVREKLWASREWRRLRVDKGRVGEGGAA